jgi:hypothetical protein
MDLNELSYRTPYENVRVNYGTGQAMGRWVSKYQLDITMILLAQNVGGNSTNTRVNGDDIFFSDTNVAKKFIKQLEMLNVPVSKSKTWLDKPFGEFSGKLADKHGSLEVYKATLLDTDNDPLGPVRQYGERGLGLVPKKYRKMVEAIASLEKPYGVESFCTAKNHPYLGFMPQLGLTKVDLCKWDERWVRTVFFKEYLASSMEQAARCKKIMLLWWKHHQKGGNVLDHPDYILMKNAWETKTKFVHELRRRGPFGSAAVQRFREPNNKLELLVDNINSPVVETNNGISDHTIVGYGSSENDDLFDRLRNKPLSVEKAYEEEQDRGNRPMIHWVVQVYKQLRLWISEFQK